jgi:hypothetical protein
VHLSQEPAVETMLRSVADHGVDPARRAQRGLVGVDPRFDLRVRERVKAEVAAAARARLDLGAMSGRVLASGIALDHLVGYDNRYGVGVLTPDPDGTMLRREHGCDYPSWGCSKAHKCEEPALRALRLGQ